MRTTHAWLMLAMLIMGASCVEHSAVDEEPTFNTRPNQIRNGTRNPTLVDLSEGQKLSVVWLHPADDPTDDFCTGVLITPYHALTAAHCTYGWPAARLALGVGQDVDMPIAHLPLSQIHEHPMVDLSLLELAQPATEQVPQIVPLPLNTTPIGESDLGSSVEGSGYGYTHVPNLDGRWFAVLELEAISSYELVVNGNGKRGLCFGDSGGPIMRHNADGEVVVIGIESMGESSCLGRDFVVRLDSLTTWLHGLIGPLPMPDPDEHGQITCQSAHMGRCDGSMLIRCIDGQLLQDDCADSHQQCGFMASDIGFGCTDNPIELPSPGCVYGEDFCDGHSRVNCRDGQFIRYDCAHEGMQCGMDAQDNAMCEVRISYTPPRTIPSPSDPRAIPIASQDEPPPSNCTVTLTHTPHHHPLLMGLLGMLVYGLLRPGRKA
ncbi:MAG: S1 family peptidase [Myxococcota bacterium]